MTTVEQILLKLGIDQSQVGPNLNDFRGKVVAACSEGHKSFLHIGSAGRAFHHLINEITASAPGLGAALKFAINPIVGTLALASMAFVYFKKQIDEVNQQLDRTAAANAKPLVNVKEAIRDAAKEMAKLCEETDKWLRKQQEGDGKDIVRGLTHQLELLESQAQVTDQLLLQKKQLAEGQIDASMASGRLSRGEGAEQKAKLEIQFAKDKRAADLAAVQNELKAREKAAADLRDQEHQAKIGVSTAFNAVSDPKKMLDIILAEQTLQGASKMLAEHDAQIKDAQKKYDELAKRDIAPGEMPGPYGSKTAGADFSSGALKVLEDLKKGRNGLEANVDRDRAGLERQQRAQRDATEKLKEAEHHYEKVNGQLVGVTDSLEKFKIKAQQMANTPLHLGSAGGGGGAVTESSRATISELAKSGHWKWFAPNYSEWQEGPFAAKAREIQKLQGEAHAANIEGDFKTRDADNLRITQLKTELGKSGVLKESEYLDAINENIANLWRQAQTDGLKIQPANGQ